MGIFKDGAFYPLGTGDDDSLASYYESQGILDDMYAEQESIAEVLSWCCQSECFETKREYVCKACGAKRQKNLGDISREALWKCADGRVVKIANMEDSHLLNTLRCLVGMSPHGTIIHVSLAVRRKLIQVMSNEAYRRHLEIPDDVRAGDPVAADAEFQRKVGA